MEIELKLTLDPAAAGKLRAHPLLAHYSTGPARTRRLANTYFDTPDLLLRRHGAGLRVRDTGAGLVQTLKGGGYVEDGLHTREEWESPVAAPRPDLAVLCALVPPGPWRTLLAGPGLADRLVPLFTTDFERTAWRLRSVHGDEVELALDIGTVSCGGLHEPICEVELELLSGAPGCLAELAQALRGGLPLMPSDVSKAQRGYALFARQAGRAG